jgi:adenosine deaminase
MKKIALFVCLLVSVSVSGQRIDKYFESIRDNTAALTAFFSQMPKGGDLHNHYSGSVYAETYISYVVQQDYAINTSTLEVKTSIPKDGKGWVLFSKLNDSGLLAVYKQKLIQKWSVKDYNGVSYPSDKQFFETFSGFNIAVNGTGQLDSGLLELKRRAQKENVSYIETMFTSIPNKIKLPDSMNRLLEEAQQNRDEAKTNALLDKMYKAVQDKNVKAIAAAYNNDVIAKLHYGLKIDDSTFTMRYQNYVVRVIPPADVFKNLVLAFESANTSPLVVGVNIVAPENDEVSMRDYWLHMQMFRYCHEKYPNVKFAMHAGELTLGMVKPEELTWHINAAVRTAGAYRIGHGTDLAYEYKCYDLLKYMAQNKIAIEINLYSNEFILKVKDDQHPITLYKEANVPIVISSDDAGVLRSNLTEQFVLLAKRYKNISYEDIKQFVYNSIDYSFIKEEGVKEKLKIQLKEGFSKFEKELMETHPEH